MTSYKLSLPERYDHLATQNKWVVNWETSQIYAWDPSQPRSKTFIVDTPPPTVSGSLHVGHAFSYTQQDVNVRYQRMLGKNIFYPMGWDDNGLPTERRVQNYFGIQCDSNQTYQADWVPNQNFDPKKDQVQKVSRQNFIEACAILTKQDEIVFENMWRALGLSVDWSQTYATIDDHCRHTSQLSFLDLIEKNLAYNSDAPTMWDIDFQSAVAQAEIEDREIAGAFHDIQFAVKDTNETFCISTTRPELLAACIAVVAHPDDKRYQHLFGKTAIVPLFEIEVPIRAAQHADPEKGTGILMVCTFGDLNDVEWWKQSGLDLKQIIGRNGRILDLKYGEAPFYTRNSTSAQAAYSQLVGLTLKQAQKKVVELLSAEGSGVGGCGIALVAEPKPTNHSVKFYEKGDRPLEFVPTRQWFIRVLDFKSQLIEQGRKIKWHPEHMRHRYEHWVNGLNVDWCISRQRYFGVPFPVWYPLDAEGNPLLDQPIYAQKDQLPVDPMSDPAPGYTAEQRGKAHGFIGDPDVMDTWATSALTPQIASHWCDQPELNEKLFPMDVRPQGHDIIRTWAFVTIAKAWMHHNEIPWKNILISGWILDPDRKKMSKSKGNVVTPQQFIEQHSADAVRYWAAKARLGADTAFDESLFKIGGKLSNKLFNASRFVLLQFERLNIDPNSVNADQITEELDRAFIKKISDLITTSSNAFNEFDYAAALQATEDLFWVFCDHYLELVKVRAYQDEHSLERSSALATLALSLKCFLRLLAPFVPFVTEEIWQASFASTKGAQSIHKSCWPTIEEFAETKTPTYSNSFELAMAAISKVRGYKTDSKKSLKWEVSQLSLLVSEKHLPALSAVKKDIIRAGNVVDSGYQEKIADISDSEFVRAEITLSEQWQNT
jgi:valyl-tRNA synthetase